MARILPIKIPRELRRDIRDALSYEFLEQGGPKFGEDFLEAVQFGNEWLNQKLGLTACNALESRVQYHLLHEGNTYRNNYGTEIHRDTGKKIFFGIAAKGRFSAGTLVLPSYPHVIQSNAYIESIVFDGAGYKPSKLGGINNTIPVLQPADGQGVTFENEAHAAPLLPVDCVRVAYAGLAY